MNRLGRPAVANKAFAAAIVLQLISLLTDSSYACESKDCTETKEPLDVLLPPTSRQPDDHFLVLQPRVLLPQNSGIACVLSICDSTRICHSQIGVLCRTTNTYSFYPGKDVQP